MISNYLKALIDSNNRIIVPDFGAFMIQDSPEGKQVSFNDFLKFNDGLLVNQIIKTDKISKNQALDKINNFIAEVKKKFAQNEPYKIEGLGILSKDSHGNIKFEKDTKTASEVKKSPTDVKPTIVLDESTEKKIEEKPATKKEESKPIPKKKPTEAKPKEEKKPESKPIAKKEATKPIIKEKTTSKPVTKEEPTKTIVKEKETTKPTTQNKPADKKPTTINTQKLENNIAKIVIIVAAILIILGGGTWAVLKYNLLGLKETPVQQVVEVEVAVPIIDTIAEDSVTPEPEVEPMVIEEPVIEENVKKYYLIAGSFKVISNANSFNKKLISEGYESEIIISNNGFNYVSINSFYSRKEANSGLNKMKESNHGIWILVQ